MSQEENFFHQYPEENSATMTEYNKSCIAMIPAPEKLHRDSPNLFGIRIRLVLA